MTHIIVSVLTIAFFYFYFKYSDYSIYQALCKRDEFVDFYCEKIVSNEKLDDDYKGMIVELMNMSMQRYIVLKILLLLPFMPLMKKYKKEFSDMFLNTEEKKALYYEAIKHFIEVNAIRSPHWYFIIIIISFPILYMYFMIKRKAFDIKNLLFTNIIPTKTGFNV